MKTYNSIKSSLNEHTGQTLNLNLKKRSKTEKARLHLYTKYHDAVFLRKQNFR
jgi:uncharacterized protein Veg